MTGVETDKAWVRVCTLDEIPADKSLALHINGQRLTLARCGDTAKVLQGFCSHMLFPLSGGKVEDCKITCSLHWSKFNVEDGTVAEWSTYPPLTGKTLSTIREQKALRTFETRVQNGEVEVLWTTLDPASVKVKLG